MLKEEQLSQFILEAAELQSEFDALTQRWEKLCEEYGAESIAGQSRFSSPTRAVLTEWRSGSVSMRFMEQTFVPTLKPIIVSQKQVVEALKAFPRAAPSFAAIREANAPDVEIEPANER